MKFSSFSLNLAKFCEICQISLNLVIFFIFAFWAPGIPIIPWARATFPALGAQGATFRILTKFSDSSHFDINFPILTKFRHFGWKRRPGVISSLGVEGIHSLFRDAAAQKWKSQKIRKSHFFTKKLIPWWKLRKWADFSISTFPDPKSTSKPYELLLFWLMWRKWMKVYETLWHFWTSWEFYKTFMKSCWRMGNLRKWDRLVRHLDFFALWQGLEARFGPGGRQSAIFTKFSEN